MSNTGIFSQLSPKNIVESGMCIGCGSCVAQSGNQLAKMDFDRFGHIKPSGPEEWYGQPSSQISLTCPFSPLAPNEDELSSELYPDSLHKDTSIGLFQKAYVGHVQEQSFRADGSSGGMVTWVATELFRNKLIDSFVHVVPSEHPDQDGNFFHFKISKNPEEIIKGAKSRYYPTELSTILETISKLPGKYAVVGVPCFIKAIQLLRKSNELYLERIKFTLGLFCGHMKSTRLIESFAVQMNVRFSDIAKVEFRHKIPDREAYWYNARLTLNNGSTVDKDWRYMVDGDWGAGFFMNSACNYCDDVTAETADIAFGDAWVEPYALDGLGTNVVVVRSELIKNLIEEARNSGRLALTEVNGTFIARTQEAGLRQRREGLAYRLTWKQPKIKPRKRVSPDKENITTARKLVYILRFNISLWSNLIFSVSKKSNYVLYLWWAKITYFLYKKLINMNKKN